MLEKRIKRTDGNTAYPAMSFRFSPETKVMLQELATHNKTSNSQMVKRLIEEKHKRVIK